MRPPKPYWVIAFFSLPLKPKINKFERLADARKFFEEEKKDWRGTGARVRLYKVKEIK